MPSSPPDLAPGVYLVAASARQDFARSENRVLALNLSVGDLVLLKRVASEGGQEAIVLSGGTGRPVAGAAVELYAFEWRKGHALVESQVADAQGRVVFAGREHAGPYFLVAKKGRDIAFDPAYLYLYRKPVPAETSRALIYTDRSIYRPGQKLYWKVLAYRGRQDLGKLRPAANAAASVWLEDINGQRVAEATAATNEFGTASGEFVIPAAGRPLGAWRLRASPEGSAGVRVEEYKRPTFEVTVKDPDKPLRLNRPAALRAEARYYFGLPVASGTAVWQVRREPVYPRWWWWETESGRSQIVAGGRARVADDGTVDVSFTPGADERKGRSGPGFSYRYTLSVDVTDEGGETRSAKRAFRLGFVDVEASVREENGFESAGAAGAFSVTRTDLDGTPRPGPGTWRVVRLVQPEATLLPADQPLPEPPGEAGDPRGFRTPGDRLRPRWDDSLSYDAVLRLWKEGKEAAAGRAEHDANGLAAVTVPGLEAGAYRLIYETKDESGGVCRESQEFLVAGKKASARLPVLMSAERSTVPVGKTARILFHSGFADQPLLLETFKGGEIWERRWLEAGKDGGVLEIPVTEELRGGFGARLTALRDHQFLTDEASVFVPWDNKELDLAFSTFRDKLAPGGRETWRVTVKTQGGKPAVQGAAELLAYMYDRSLDLFAPHHPPSLLSLYPNRAGTAAWDPSLGMARQAYSDDSGLGAHPVVSRRSGQTAS